jgi:hypothetical protein
MEKSKALLKQKGKSLWQLIIKPSQESPRVMAGA